MTIKIKRREEEEGGEIRSSSLKIFHNLPTPFFMASLSITRHIKNDQLTVVNADGVHRSSSTWFTGRMTEGFSTEDGVEKT